MTQKKIENALGLTGSRPVHHLSSREKKDTEGIRKQRGRKPAKILAEYKNKNMENELSRDFLRFTTEGRFKTECIYRQKIRTLQ